MATSNKDRQQLRQRVRDLEADLKQAEAERDSSVKIFQNQLITSLSEERDTLTDLLFRLRAELVKRGIEPSIVYEDWVNETIKLLPFPTAHLPKTTVHDVA